MNISELCFIDVHSPSAERFLFDFEKNFDYWPVYFWVSENCKLCFYFTGVYLLAIFAGKRYMESRPPFQLRGPLIAWNLTFAFVSIAISVRMMPFVSHTLSEIGFFATICDRGSVQQRKVGGLVGTLFLALKVVELGDTAFIVLRKSRLIFLHCYHHVSVLIFSWMCAAYLSTIQQHFLVINILMHSFEYSFYALKALQVNVPRRVNIAITSMQLLEMLFGIFVTYTAFRLKRINPDCCVYDQTINFAAAMYASYFVLFLNFFMKSYIVNKGELFDEKGAIKKSS